MFLNRQGLPAHFLGCLAADPYTGGGDISVTKLIDAPQIRTLLKTYGDTLPESDAADMVPVLLGQSVHAMLERSSKSNPALMVETRLYAEVEGWQVSGQFDVYDRERKTLDDYKVTSTYKYPYDIQWERQLNVLAWLCRQQPEPLPVEKLGIVALFRDWSRAKMVSGYPPSWASYIDVRLWSAAEADAYVTERVLLHQRADAGENVLCTDSERWRSGETTYAVMRPERTRALRVFGSRFEANELAAQEPMAYIQERPGVYRRCKSYCPVASFCPQYAETT